MSARGPYYDDGTVQIWHGRAEDVLPDLSGVACTVTSPPYNTLGSRVPAKPTGGFGSQGLSGWAEKVNRVGYADDMPENAYQEWQRELAGLVHAASRPGASFFYNHKCRSRDGRIIHPVHLTDSFDGWALRQEIVWDRPGAVAFNARMFAPSDERIMWLVRDDGAPHVWNQEAAVHLSVWRLNPVVSNDHPCPFPETIPRRCIAATTDPADLVLDPFAGTGTTLMAAKSLGRRAIGIDTCEAFCEIAAKRCAQEVLAL